MDGKITYPKNFITKVFFRLDFSIIDSLADEPTQFKELVKEIFPKMEPVVRTGYVFQAQENQQLTTKQETQTIWQFTSADGKIICNLLPNSLVIQASAYTNFTAFSEITEAVLTAFYSSYETITIGRVGLRYINEIVIPDDTEYLNWDGYINPLIFPIVQYSPANTELKRSLNTAEYSLDTETSLNIRTGIFNSSYPSKILRKEFVIDLDCYSNRTPENKDSLLAMSKRFNDVITETFESIIGDRLRILLNNE